MVTMMGASARGDGGAAEGATEIAIGKGWAESSINTVIFRHSPLVTFRDTQYAAFYDGGGHVVLAKRKVGADQWETRRTALTGNAKDAHNTIALGVDGNGIVHMAWDHHNNDLNYVQTVSPGSLELTGKLKTDGVRETKVTYPEFYSMANGDLLLTYRVGSSGNGDVVLKRYDAGKRAWKTLQSNLVQGDSVLHPGVTQNAYTEMNVDVKGTIHLGWVWRRTPDVETNHDICYARSTDGGLTWTDSTGKELALPITDATCETAVKIPEKSDLINQTTIAADDAGHPYIATYYKTEENLVAQVRVVYNDGTGWKSSQVGERQTALNLGGGGTKKIPLSRPLVLVDSGEHPRVHVVFRDADRGAKVTLATTTEIAKGDWKMRDLTTEGVGSWEPTYDPVLWRTRGILDLLLQKVDQLDGGDNQVRAHGPAPTMVYVLECKP
ncbi:MAG: BNR repeat-containing protein [Phycisphaerae bacterium]